MRSEIRSLVDGEVLARDDIGEWISSLRPLLSPVDTHHPLVDRCSLGLAVQPGHKLRFANQP